MREIILFRGKRADNGEWIYDDLIQNVDCIKIREQEKDIKHISKSFEIDPETVGQYTGLTDKNGKKIFEGDILKYVLKNSGEEYIEGVVVSNEWNCSCCDGVFGFRLDGGDLREYKIYEVAGNIHDNSELLE